MLFSRAKAPFRLEIELPTGISLVIETDPATKVSRLDLMTMMQEAIARTDWIAVQALYGGGAPLPLSSDMEVKPSRKALPPPAAPSGPARRRSPDASPGLGVSSQGGTASPPLPGNTTTSVAAG